MVDFNKKMKSAYDYRQKELEASSTNVGYYADGGDTGENVDEAAAWADLSRDWAVSTGLVTDPVASDYSSKHYSEESKKGAAAATDEGNLQVARVAAEGTFYLAEIKGEGDSQAAKVIAEGTKQKGIVEEEGNVQAARSSVEADRAEAEADASEASAVASAASAVDSKSEADKAEAIANTLDDAIRNAGYFAVSLLAYPIPSDQIIPFVWFCTDTGDIGDGIIWSEGDMLQYVPHSTDPVGTFGNYFRVAGELTGGIPPAPQPITILDDLIMFQDKKIIFQTVSGTAQRDVLHLDTEGDIVLGQHTAGGDKIAKCGIAATDLFIINELDPSGVAGTVRRIAPEDEVDSKDATTLASASSYTDSTNATQDVEIALKETIVNVDSKDATTLASANTHTDSTNATQDVEIALKETIVNVDSKIAAAITADRLNSRPVGSIELRIDAINPSTIFGGTWALLPTGGSLSTGDGTAQTGAIIGSDTVSAPLLEHIHANTATASSAFTGAALPGHVHDNGHRVFSGAVAHKFGTVPGGATIYVTTTDAVPGESGYTDSPSAGTPSGTVGTTVTMANALAGTAGATINVAGAKLVVNVWQRTA